MKKYKKSSVKPLTHSTSGAATLQLEKVGVREFDFKDPYHLALTMSWPQFFVGLFIGYMVINSFFAFLYYLAPGSVSNMPAGSFWDAFFFSIETLATVGYGNMAPITTYSHTVSAIEVFVGMLLTATMTGLVFVRFSKPKAKLLFAHQAVVMRRSGAPRLMIRIGNGRMNALNDANVRVTTFGSETAANGQRIRTMVDLPLMRSEMPFSPLTWTLIHELSDDSPLAALRSLNAAELQASGVRLLVSITAHDPALGAQVYANHAYGPEQIALDMRYADAITSTHENHSVADMRKISDTLPDI
jgi:inward rectifier potassium channel